MNKPPDIPIYLNYCRTKRMTALWLQLAVTAAIATTLTFALFQDLRHLDYIHPLDILKYRPGFRIRRDWVPRACYDGRSTPVRDGDFIHQHYIGRLVNGTKFDARWESRWLLLVGLYTIKILPVLCNITEKSETKEKDRIFLLGNITAVKTNEQVVVCSCLIALVYLFCLLNWTDRQNVYLIFFCIQLRSKWNLQFLHGNGKSNYWYWRRYEGHV